MKRVLQAAQLFSCAQCTSRLHCTALCVTHARNPTRMHPCMHLCMHTPTTRACMRAHAHAHARTHTHTHTHTYIHTHTHTHTHTHSHTQRHVPTHVVVRYLHALMHTIQQNLQRVSYHMFSVVYTFRTLNPKLRHAVISYTFILISIANKADSS
jgi:hypothetical protein